MVELNPVADVAVVVVAADGVAADRTPTEMATVVEHRHRLRAATVTAMETGAAAGDRLIISRSAAQSLAANRKRKSCRRSSLSARARETARNTPRSSAGSLLL